LTNIKAKKVSFFRLPFLAVGGGTNGGVPPWPLFPPATFRKQIILLSEMLIGYLYDRQGVGYGDREFIECLAW
jgi:hypothetical protein